MDDAQLVEWLLANGGPIVRWHAATELMRDVPTTERSALVAALLSARTILR